MTACTVGYGDVSGGTALEQLAVVLTVIVGVTFIAFSVKSMVDVLLEAALQARGGGGGRGRAPPPPPPGQACWPYASPAAARPQRPPTNTRLAPQDEGAQRVALLRDRGRALTTWSRWQSTTRDVMDKILACAALRARAGGLCFPRMRRQTRHPPAAPPRAPRGPKPRLLGRPAPHCRARPRSRQATRPLPPPSRGRSFYQGPGLDHAMQAATWGRLLAELPSPLRGEVLWQVFFRHHPVRGRARAAAFACGSLMQLPLLSPPPPPPCDGGAPPRRAPRACVSPPLPGQEVRPLGVQLLSSVAAPDAVHVLAQLEVAPLCVGHTLCWEGDTADSVWLLQARPQPRAGAGGGRDCAAEPVASKQGRLPTCTHPPPRRRRASW